MNNASTNPDRTQLGKTNKPLMFGGGASGNPASLESKTGFDYLLTEDEIDRVFETGGANSDYWNAVAITAQRKLWNWLISVCTDKSHYGHDDPMLRLERMKCPDCKYGLVKMMGEL